jgi:hypothetical protein
LNEAAHYYEWKFYQMHERYLNIILRCGSMVKACLVSDDEETETLQNLGV